MPSQYFLGIPCSFRGSRVEAGEGAKETGGGVREVEAVLFSDRDRLCSCCSRWWTWDFNRCISLEAVNGGAVGEEQGAHRRAEGMVRM